jgi:hypothetical protein
MSRVEFESSNGFEPEPPDFEGHPVKGCDGEFTIGPSDVSGSTEISPQVDSEIHDRDIGVDPKYPGFKGIEN